MVIHNPILTGSFTVNNIDVSSITSSAANITALNATTASLNSFSASVLTFTGSASTRLGALEAATASLYTVTSSFSGRVGALETYTSSLNNKTSSFATTGSNTFIGSQVISGSLTTSGSITSTSTITAQTLVVQTITSSVVYSSGSNVFGNVIGNTQTFTGSMLITGSNIIANVSTACFSGQLCVGSSLVLGTNNSYALYLKDSTGTPKPVMATASNTNINFYNVCSTGQIQFRNAADSAVITTIDNSGNVCFASTVTGTTIYGSTAVCSPVGLFSGCVGIGTSTPSQPLQVYSNISSSSNVTAEFYNGDYGTGTRNFIRLRNGATIASTTSAYFGQGQDQKTYIYNNDFSRPGDIVITNTGKVGIGISSPIAQLHVKAFDCIQTTNLCTAYTSAKFRIDTYCGSGQGISMGNIGGYYQYIQGQYSDGATTNPLMVNPFGGNVGINRTDSNYNLDISDNTGGTLNISHRNSSATTYKCSSLLFSGYDTICGEKLSGAIVGESDTANYYGGHLKFLISTGNIYTVCSLVEAMRITSNAYVGINITSACKHLEVGGTIRTTASPSVYYRDMSYIGDTYQFGSSETTDNVDYRICGGSTWSTGGNFRWSTQVGNTTPSERMRITPGGSVGIATTNPRTQLDIGDIHDGIGGTTFCSFLVAQGVWATFACITDNDANVITDITYVNNNDSNRSGALLARWAYNGTCAGTYIVNCGWNWSQNINTFGIRNNGGALQICLSGGGNGYRVQARTQGARATG